jgi:hypothetical protein
VVLLPCVQVEEGECGVERRYLPAPFFAPKTCTRAACQAGCPLKAGGPRGFFKSARVFFTFWPSVGRGADGCGEAVGALAAACGAPSGSGVPQDI